MRVVPIVSACCSSSLSTVARSTLKLVGLSWAIPDAAGTCTRVLGIGS